MRKVILAACLLSLSGCTINLVDKRLSREEVAAAFKQRDAAIEGLAQAIKELQPKEEEKK
jgi:hypothetical protein